MRNTGRHDQTGHAIKGSLPRHVAQFDPFGLCRITGRRVIIPCHRMRPARIERSRRSPPRPTKAKDSNGLIFETENGDHENLSITKELADFERR